MLEYFGYIYCITSPTNRNYVGQKRSSTFIENYWGTPGKNNDLYKEYEDLYKQGIFSDSYELLGYKREILEWCYSQEELNKQEKYWIKEKHSHITEGGYNRSWGLGEDSIFSGWSTGLHWYNNGKKETCCEECPGEDWIKGRLKSTFIKQSNSLKERYKKDENLKNKIGRKNKGRKHSEKSKENIRNGLIKRWQDPIIGKQLKEKLSKRSLGKSPANKGLHWYNNRIENIQAKKCPKGFQSGMISKNSSWNKGKKMSEEWKLKHPSSTTKGYKWYNNGIIQIFSKENPGENFTLGKLKKESKHKQNKTVLYSQEWRNKVSQSLRDKKPNNGKKWWNNGFKEVFQFECPEGFTKGRLKHRGKNND